MLAAIGYASLDELAARGPARPGIGDRRPLGLPPALSEAEALAELRRLAGRNTVARVDDRAGLLRHASPRR